MKMYKKGILLSCILFISIFLIGIQAHQTKAAIKLSYNHRTINYKGTQIATSIDMISVTKGKTKGIKMNGVAMGSYLDVFKVGAKAKCKYKSKKLTIQKNGIKLTMWVGNRTIYVNGKKKKLPVAPTQVTYKKYNKMKILVPLESVSKYLKYKYKWSAKTKTTMLTSPFCMKEGKKAIYYYGYQGSAVLNSTSKQFNSIPVIKYGGGNLAPAKDVFKNGLDCSYTYNNTSKKITLKYGEQKVIMYTGSNQATCNGKAYTLSIIPRKLKNLTTGKSYVCVPVASTAKKLGLLYKWDNNLHIAYIHKDSYFSWSTTNTSFDTTTYSNALSGISCNYAVKDQSINFKIVGSNESVMKDQVTFAQQDKDLTITFPKTKYLLTDTIFQSFYEIAESIEVKQDSTNVIMIIRGKSPFTYEASTSGGILNIKIYVNYINGSLSGAYLEYIGDYQMKFQKPTGVTFDMITNVDSYANKKFKIYISGNHVAFLKSNPIIANCKAVKSINVSLTESGNTCITVTTSKLQGYKIYDSTNSIVVQIGNPRDIYKNIVILDAGHGGVDPGAVSNGIYEKNMNFLMIYTLMKPYFSSNAPDTKAYWTRTTDVKKSLSMRAAYAKTMGADAFISLHMNCWTKSSVNGTEVYYSNNNNSSSFSGVTSKKMASLFKTRLVSAMGTTDRGISSQKYTVVYKNTVPAILIELGFISGASDSLKIKDSTYQAKATATIYNTINELFTKYPTGR